MPPKAGPYSAAPAGLPRAPTERQVLCFSPQALHKPQEETGVTVNSICVLWKEQSHSFHLPACYVCLGSSSPMLTPRQVTSDRSQLSTSLWLGKCHQLKMNCRGNSNCHPWGLLLAGIKAPSSLQFKRCHVHLNPIFIPKAFV